VRRDGAFSYRRDSIFATLEQANVDDSKADCMMTLSVAFPAVSAAFLGALVEAVEAVTIVLAVATVRGWRFSSLESSQRRPSRR